MFFSRNNVVYFQQGHLTIMDLKYKVGIKTWQFDNFAKHIDRFHHASAKFCWRINGIRYYCYKREEI